MFYLYGSLILLAVVLFVVIQFWQRRKNEQVKSHDPRKNLNPNSTNYNVAMYEPSSLEKMSKDELKNLLDTIKSDPLTSLSPRDFYYIQRRLEE